MAGLGQRFTDAGFDKIKPLIEVAGRPMIQAAIETLGIEGDYIFIVRESKKIEEIKKLISSIKPGSKIIEISEVTEGPACTCLLAKEYINNKDPLVIANCDQIMEWDGDKFLKHAERYDGSVVTYNSDTPKNSYVKINKKRHAVELAEKKVISKHSLNGIHYWRHGEDFVRSAEEMISNNERTNNEFYVAPTYNYLIKEGKKISSFKIPKESHNPVGTPEDLIKYSSRVLNRLIGDLGLKYIPTLGKNFDDLDKIKGPERQKYGVKHNFSTRNSDFLKECIKNFKPRTILEIGVNCSIKGGKRYYTHSSTYSFMCHLKTDKEFRYLGVDLSKENTDIVYKENKAIKDQITFYNGDSADFDKISEYINSHLGGKIDMILVDGWHSVNQVMKEWRFSTYLSREGCVILHDTNNHPGPKELLAALNEDIFKIEQPFLGRYDDWGIACVSLKRDD